MGFADARLASVDDLQRLAGLRNRGANLEIFYFADTGYMESAMEYANRHGIFLFLYEQSGEISPASYCARRLEYLQTGATPYSSDAEAAQANKKLSRVVGVVAFVILGLVILMIVISSRAGVESLPGAVMAAGFPGDCGGYPFAARR
ncbi:hypothetical protein [Hoyosella altamirensis]|uniref:Restriction endonuclease type IV Mrr domain-containing protein n=1 Tax=Hoyosella altamirensis TaxID=616997 RepID=A0A839RSB7_9ACTN|nr:hypothetical protein [Hoyosella altamirensis]MBB3039755.1 hypothetical protein [Hoyosella altamirensis]